MACESVIRAHNSEILDIVSEIEVIIDEADDVVLPGTSEETFLDTVSKSWTITLMKCYQSSSKLPGQFDSICL
jgi:hypothetical protein